MVFSVVDRPPDLNPLGTTMVYKYKIDQVKNTVTGKCRLCLRGDCQKEGLDFFKYKTYSAVLKCRENRALFWLAAANHWLCSHQISLEPLLMASWMFSYLLSITWI